MAGKSWLKRMLLALSFGLSFFPSAVLAAEQVRIEFGPFQQTLKVSDLETFIAKDLLPPDLEAYFSLLQAEQRRTIRQSIQLNPDLSASGLQDMLAAPMGTRLVAVLGKVITNANPEQIRLALSQASAMPKGLNLINLLRAFPSQVMVINVPAIFAVKAQLERDYAKSRALGPQLAADLLRPDVAFTAPFDPAAEGPQIIKVEELKLTDKTRQREISMRFYLGQAADLGARQDGPLIIMFHGLGGNQNALAYLARHLASHGFTVVTLQHPDRTALARTTEVTLGGGLYLPAAEFIERPKDVSFVLDQLAALNQKPGALMGRLNTNRVSVIGQSLGGTTALTLAGGEINLDSLRTSCQAIAPVGRFLGDWALCNATSLPDQLIRLEDRRVTQAIVINPVVGDLFGSQGLRWVHTSTLMVSSSGDSIAPAIENHLRPFNILPGTKYLITAIGATHLSTNDTVNIRDTRRLRVVSERLGQENQAFQTLIRGSALAFIQQSTPSAQRYQAFLTPGYAQSLSTPALPLRFSTQLPVSIVNRLQENLQTGTDVNPIPNMPNFRIPNRAMPNTTLIGNPAR
jgi:predicted dienelactone hydrolase